LENNEFKYDFLKRLQELLDNQLSYQITSPIYQKAIEEIANEVQRQIYRFSFPKDYEIWVKKVFKIKEFLTVRNCIMANQARQLFKERITAGNCNYEKVEVSEMELYPNPNNGGFTITFNSTETAPAFIKIFNLLGQEVASFDHVIQEGLNILSYNLPNIPNGLFFVSVGTEKQLFGTKMRKF